MKEMPYRLPEDGLEVTRIRCHAAVKRAEAECRVRRRSYRWAVSLATVVVGVFVVLAGLEYVGRDTEFTSPHYEKLMSMMENAPVDVVYDMSVDAVEYYEDVSML
ncbi:MAG: hypothetical protein IIV91_04455 [Alistipes sp.]|nr:hypothetical protein [Alistipes sp.]